MQKKLSNLKLRGKFKQGFYQIFQNGPQRYPYWAQILLVSFFAILAGLAFVPWRNWFLYPIAVIGFMVVLLQLPIGQQLGNVIQKITFKKFGIGFQLFQIWWFFFLQNVISLSWTGQGPAEFSPEFRIIGWAIAILLPALLASFYLPFTALALYVWRRHDRNLYQYPSNNTEQAKAGLVLTLILFWLSFGFNDYLRSFFLGGFPWNIAAHAMLYLPQVMPMVGVFGQTLVSFWVYGLAFLPLLCLARPDLTLTPANSYRKNITILFRHRHRTIYLFLLFLLLPFLVGFFSNKNDKADPTTAKSEQIFIRLVQPGTSIAEQQHTPLLMRVNQLKNLSMVGLSSSTRLVIWPESAVNADISQHVLARRYVTDFLKSGQFLLLGSLRDFPSETTGTEIKNFSVETKTANSMLLLDDRGQLQEFYDKHHLVPLGEYIPFENYLPFLPIAARGIDLAAGKAPYAMAVGTDFYFVPLICYETAFPELSNRIRIERDNNNLPLAAIIAITNDAWFGKEIGPEQHLFLAQLRAVENGLPVIRVALNGISAVIAADGRILTEIASGERAVIDILLPDKLTKPPFYSRYQQLLDQGFGLLTLVLLIMLATPTVLRHENHRAKWVVEKLLAKKSKFNKKSNRKKRKKRINYKK